MMRESPSAFKRKKPNDVFSKKVERNEKKEDLKHMWVR